MRTVKNISVFDLDGTLWEKNSHLLILNSYFHTGFYTGLFARFFSHFFKSTWQHKIDKKLQEIPSSFIENFDITEFKINIKVKKLLEDKKKNSKVVFISNAPEQIVHKAANYFGVDGFHADTGEKSDILQENFNYEKLFVCTDNKSDADLLEIADDKVFIKKAEKKKFYIPLLYTLNTRYIGILGFLSFFITSVFPSILYFHIFITDENINQSGISFLCSYLIINSIYEIGYVINDVYSLRKEKSPTLRLSKQELEFSENNILRIINIRLLFIILLYAILICLDTARPLFYISCLLLMSIYLVHNNINSRYRFLSNSLLVTFRFLAPFLIFPLQMNAESFISLFITLPLLKTATYLFKKNFNRSERFLDNFQLIYYFVLSFVFALCSFVLDDKKIQVSFICSLALFLYRCSVSLLKKTRRN